MMPMMMMMTLSTFFVAVTDFSCLLFVMIR